MRVVSQSELSILVDAPGEELHLSGGFVFTKNVNDLLADLDVFNKVIIESIYFDEFREVSKVLRNCGR